VRFRWIGWAIAGIAVMGGAGYLLAALVLFPSPLHGNDREVPPVIGLGEDDARRDINRLGLEPAITSREPHPLAQPGTIIWQDPSPGVSVPRSFRVELHVSSGLPMVAVPNLRGFDASFAQRLLAAAGLGVDNLDSIDDSGPWPDGVSVPSGTVAGTVPAAGDSVPLGLRVLLHVTR
jgi:serine/threonine-protein kinase